MITTTSGYKKALEESERDVFGNYTWRQAASNIDYQTQLAEAQARQLYGEDVATAYQAATQQRQMIGVSALGEGTKARLEQSLADTMSAAYDKYMADYQSNLSTIATQAEKAYGELGTALEERAANMQAFQDEHYKYLQYLDEWRQENAMSESDLAEFFDLTGWGKYYKDAPMYDAQGNLINTEKQLKSWEELTTPVKDEITGEYISFYDNEGNLTRAGRNFFTQIENYYGSKALKEGETNIPSFAAYLYKANPELYDWANTYNPYSYTPTSEGISENIGAFRQLLGIRTDADEYRFIEYFGGLSKKEIDNVFNDMYSKLNTENITMDNAVESFQEIRGLAEKLGFTADDTDWEAAEEQVKALVNTYQEHKAEAETQYNIIGTAKTAEAASIATAMVVIISALAAVPTGGASLIGTAAGIGSLSTALGASAAGIGLDVASNNAEALYEQAKALAGKSETELKDLYRGIITSLVADVQSEYTNMAIREGGVLASKGAQMTVGSSYTALEDWAKATDTPLTDQEFARISNQLAPNSSDRKDYYVQGLGTGRNNDDIDITIGSTSRDTKTEFDLLCGNEVTNDRIVQYLNKYSTGNAKTTPAKGKLIVVANKMYIYTAKGWRNVKSDHSNVEDAIKNFLQ